MSKITNPMTESSVSCGFYNSMNDRRYDALQMSSIFDGIIRDGIFATIGDSFVVNAGTDSTVLVGTGKCWFNHTWTINDAELLIDLSVDEYKSSTVLNRIDAIVIEVNTTDAVRDNFIKVVKGSPATTPNKPTLTNSDGVYQHALCYITRPAGSTVITQADIENVVGTDETPFVTGILDVVSLDKLLGQWRAELDEFVDEEKTDVDVFLADMKQLILDAEQEIKDWTIDEKIYIRSWFDDLKRALSSEDVATDLYTKINRDEIERFLTVGFVDGTKTFSDDGTVITSVDSTGRTIVKTFTNDFLSCTTVLNDSAGREIGRMIKTFSSDGKTITSEVII